MGIGEKRNRSEQAKRTRQLIFETARDLFDQYGPHAVSVDDIVTRANVAKGSFYVHFESRDALITELIYDQVVEIDTDYLNYIEQLPTGMDFEEKILAVIEQVSAVLCDRIGPRKMSVLFKTQLSKAQLNVDAIGYERSLFMASTGLLEQWARAYQLADAITGKKLAVQFFTVYRGLIYEWCMRQPDYDLRTEALEIFTLLMTGIKIKYRNISIGEMKDS